MHTSSRRRDRIADIRALRRTALLGCSLLWAVGLGGSAEAKSRFTAFQVQKDATLVTAINVSGATTGYYTDGNGIPHGFVRSAAGMANKPGMQLSRSIHAARRYLRISYTVPQPSGPPVYVVP